MNTLFDPDFVDVEKEVDYWLALTSQAAPDQMDFHKYTEPVIRAACDIYIRHPHAAGQQWMRELDGVLRRSCSDNGMQLNRMVAEKCWLHLQGNV